MVKVYQQELFAAITEGVVLCAHLQLDPATPTNSDDSAADAQAQRHRGLGDDAKDRLEALPPACALRTNHFRYDRRTQQLPLTWVRVPAGALQNGTHFA